MYETQGCKYCFKNIFDLKFNNFLSLSRKSGLQIILNSNDRTYFKLLSFTFLILKLECFV